MKTIEMTNNLVADKNRVEAVLNTKRNIVRLAHYLWECESNKVAPLSIGFEREFSDILFDVNCELKDQSATNYLVLRMQEELSKVRYGKYVILLEAAFYLGLFDKYKVTKKIIFGNWQD